MINAKDIKIPSLPREIHESPALGGRVVVRGITLTQRFELHDLVGNNKWRIVPELLAMSVLDISDTPVMSAEQWDVLGSIDSTEVMRLYGIAKRLAGMGEESPEKK
jgi:hypothetical protein